jgi:NodT family efflux transporter outer membrane factor (OMF) lipoprotein
MSIKNPRRPTRIESAPSCSSRVEPQAPSTIASDRRPCLVCARRLAASSACLLIAACAVGPDFKRPPAPDVAGYTERPLPTATAATPTAGGTAQRFELGADLPAQWWTLFGSPSLTGLVEQALAHSPDVAAAQAALRQARENVLATRGSLLPAFDGRGNVTRQKVSGAQFGSPGAGGSLFTLYNASVNVSYAIDLFGGVRRAFEAAQAQEEYQRFQLEAAKLTLAANVTTAAIREASLRAQLEATEAILADQRRQLEVIRRQHELGGVSQLEVLTQQTLLAQTEASLPELRKQLEQNRDLLAVLLGRFPSEGIRSRFSLDELNLPADLPLSLPSKLVERRPDIRAQEAQLHRASAEIGVATANLLPQITLSGDFGDVSTRIGELIKSGSNVWSLGAGITQPLFHGGTLLHQRRAAVAAHDQALANYRSTVLHAFQDVADTLHALHSDADALAAQERAEQAAARALAIARSQYEAGAISYLSLLDAERSEQQARINLIQARAARYADTAALFQALGGGWWASSQASGADSPPALQAAGAR